MGNITHFQSNHKKLQTGESWRSAEVGLHYSHFHQAEITQSAPGMSLNGFKPGPAEACSFLKSRLTVLCLGSEEPKTPNQEQFRQTCSCSANPRFGIVVFNPVFTHTYPKGIWPPLCFLICSYKSDQLQGWSYPCRRTTKLNFLHLDTTVAGIIKRTYTILQALPRAWDTT